MENMVLRTGIKEASVTQTSVIRITGSAIISRIVYARIPIVSQYLTHIHLIVDNLGCTFASLHQQQNGNWRNVDTTRRSLILQFRWRQIVHSIRKIASSGRTKR